MRERSATMTPTAIGQTAEGPVVLWRDLGNLDLDQPVFRGTVERAQRLSGDPQDPFRAAPPLRTGLDALAEAAVARPRPAARRPDVPHDPLRF